MRQTSIELDLDADNCVGDIAPIRFKDGSSRS
jgi:hypothetical protein